MLALMAAVKILQVPMVIEIAILAALIVASQDGRYYHGKYKVIQLNACLFKKI